MDLASETWDSLSRIDCSELWRICSIFIRLMSIAAGIRPSDLTSRREESKTTQDEVLGLDCNRIVFAP